MKCHKIYLTRPPKTNKIVEDSNDSTVSTMDNTGVKNEVVEVQSNDMQSQNSMTIQDGETSTIGESVEGVVTESQSVSGLFADVFERTSLEN